MTTRISTRACYKLRGEPSFIVGGPHRGTFEFATFTADRTDGAVRIWQVNASRLFDTLSSYVDQELAQVACDELQAGSVTQLPGIYSAVDLVRMGFREARRLKPSRFR